MIKASEVFIQLLLGAAILLLLTFLLTQFAVNALILGTQSVLALVSRRRPASL